MREIDLKTEHILNPFAMFKNGGGLITVGRPDSYNTMTIGFGTVGTVWGKPIATVYVREERYTYEFIEREPYFTVSLYGEELRDAMRICGTESGRDGDKAAKAGLTPVFDGDAVYFEGAKVVLCCKKIYRQMLDPDSFVDEGLHKHYPEHDYHMVYYGEIVKAFVE